MQIFVFDLLPYRVHLDKLEMGWRCLTRSARRISMRRKPRRHTRSISMRGRNSTSSVMTVSALTSTTPRPMG